LKNIILWRLPDCEDHKTLKDRRLWGTKMSRQSLSSSKVVSIRLRLYNLSFDHVQIQTKNFNDKRNDKIIPVAVKEFQMSHERIIHIKKYFNVLDWSFSTNLNAMTPLQCLSNPCLYKELKTWRKTTILCSFNCALTLSNSKAHRTLKNSLLSSYLGNSIVLWVCSVIVYISNCM